MDKAKVLVGSDEEAKRRQAAGQEKRSLLGWLKRTLGGIMKRKKKNKDIEIYPLY
jgi:hypothetical protein